MRKLKPFTEEERERIYQGRMKGKTIPEIADELDRSVYGVRKWWRRIRDEGAAGLRTRRRGPEAKGTLSSFDPEVVEKALKLKREHPRWGANRVILELEADETLEGSRVPRRSQLSAFFKEKCPECIAHRQPRSKKPKAPPAATAVHEVWQLDSQEKIELRNGEIATICNIRDPYGAAIITSQAFSVKTEKRWRKLKWEEVRQVLRIGFTEWGTLPDSVLNDNELGLAGAPTVSFPSKLTLWLVGLGIKHRFIRPHCPTDQPHIERTHRIVDDLALNEASLANMDSLQASLNKECSVYNHLFPSRASDCGGKPPLVAHPELLHPRKPYTPELELALFDIRRVYHFLAEFTFARTVNVAGQVSLGRTLYSIGRRFNGKSVLVRLDPDTCEWIFVEPIQQDDKTIEEELTRLPIKHLDVTSLTGLVPQPIELPEPIQLTLPCLAA